MQAPDAPTYITLDFEKGVPVALDGQKMTAKEIILKLNELGGANGVGLLDIVENRLVGMKCRGVYETPGGAILYKALQVLETLCLDKYTPTKSRSWPSPLPIWSTTASGIPPCARPCPPLWMC